MSALTGSLQIKKGHYYAVVNMPSEDGKRRQRWISTGLQVNGNKKTATHRLREILNELEEQNHQFHSGIKFWELLDMWLEASKQRMRESTYRNCKWVFNAHIIPYFRQTGVKLQDLCPHHLEEYYQEKLETLSPYTLHKHHSYIHSALEYGRKNRLVNQNAAADAWVPPVHKKQVGSYYTMEQLAELKQLIIGDPIEVPLMLIISYGFRRSEALGLKWDAVDFEGKTISIRATVIKSGTEVKYVMDTKSRASVRTLPMSDEFAEYLRGVQQRQAKDKEKYGNMYQDDNFVCAAKNGKVINPNCVTERFKKIIRANGLPDIRLHDLRHTAATHLLAMGFSVKDVAFWLGHSQTSTTLDIYSHVLEGSKVDMANALWNGTRPKTGTQF